MYVAHLALHNFRSFADTEVSLEPGVTAFIGRNGQGKTNLVEAIDYVARLTSHRVAGDAPLVRFGSDRAVVRAAVVREDRQALLEIEINPGKVNRARINKSPLPKARELLGLVRTVLFSPEDLALAKGDPSERRRFLDDLLVLQAPRFAGVRADYDRVLRQRNTLLKTAGGARRASKGSGAGKAEGALKTLDVWDAHLARTGAELLAARLGLVEELKPLVSKAYQAIARDASRSDAAISYKCSFELPSVAGPPTAVEPEGTQTQVRTPDRNELAAAILEEVARRRSDELDRGVSLVGPHRDELTLTIGPLPVRGYASHGESWSFALALRLASYNLLRAGGDDPILILDDVFAELDADRRERLAEMVAGAEQVLVTAAVPADVPASLAGARIDVVDGEMRREDPRVEA